MDTIEARRAEEATYSEDDATPEREFTLRTIAAGAVIGALVAAVNMYMGLKIAFTGGGAILSAILCFAVVRAFGGRLTIRENNIGQTLASGAASLGIMVSVVPALIMMGQPIGTLNLMVWIFLVGITGVLFAVPLRKQFVVMDALPFPTGTACAATIRAMHAKGESALDHARTLGLTGIVSAIITWFRDGVPKFIPDVTMGKFPIGGITAEQLGVGFSWSPMLLGAGVMVGLRTGISLLLGGILGWAVLGPALYHGGIIDGIGMRQISRWTMWLAIPLMVSSGFVSFFMRGRTIPETFRSMMGAGRSGGEGGEVPFTPWAWAMAAVALATACAMQCMFGVAFWMAMVAIVLSFLLASVAVRAYGETDVSPVGTMGHTTQIVFGAIARGQLLPNLMTAGITAGCANTAADMMQDLKAGHLLGSTPRKLVAAQCLGVLVGTIVAVPIFNLLVRAYGLGTEALPAPAALLWSGMARLLSQGFSTLPPMAGYAIAAGTLFGVLLTTGGRTRWKKYLPSPLGIGIGIIIPVAYTACIFLGSLLGALALKSRLASDEDALTYAGSGLIAGEALPGVLIAVLKVAGAI